VTSAVSRSLLGAGGTGLVIVMNHALADEIGGLAILASLVDESPGLPPAGPRAVPFPGPGAGALAVDAWAGRARRLAHLPATMRTIGQGLTDPALLEVLRDRGSGLGREPLVVHARRLSPDACTDIRAGPAPGPEAHRQFAMARTRSRYDPRDCYPNLRPIARVSAELPLALVDDRPGAGQRLPRSLPCRWSSTRR